MLEPHQNWGINQQEVGSWPYFCWKPQNLNRVEEKMDGFKKQKQPFVATGENHALWYDGVWSSHLSHDDWGYHDLGNLRFS
jgi:hypothetical protein